MVLDDVLTLQLHVFPLTDVEMKPIQTVTMLTFVMS